MQLKQLVVGGIQTGVLPCNISFLGRSSHQQLNKRERGSNTAGSVLQLLLGPPIWHLNVDSEDTGNKNHQLNVIFITSYTHVMIKHLSSGCFSKETI